MPYAERTDVPVSKSKEQIERLLRQHGCDAFMVGFDDREQRAAISFRMHARLLRFEIRVPTPDELEWAGERRRTVGQRQRAREQAERQRWRALWLVIRAKLESVESGVESFEEAFLPHIVLPDNSTVGQRMLPAVAEAYETGRMPQMDRLLPAAGGTA